MKFKSGPSEYLSSLHYLLSAKTAVNYAMALRLWQAPRGKKRGGGDFVLLNLVQQHGCDAVRIYLL